MKIKRYQANDMRSAIRIVRNELGSDAVILSNQRVGDKTEVIAAIEYDESLLNDSQLSYPTNSETATSKTELSRDLKYTRNLPTETFSPVTNESEFSLPDIIEKDLISKIGKELIEKIKLNNDNTSLLNSMSELPAMTDMKKQIGELRKLLLTQISELSSGKGTKNNPLRSMILNRLVDFGLSKKLANEIASLTDIKKDLDYNWRHALAKISQRVQVTKDDILSKGGVVALIGATGVGKTTSIAKLAAQFILRHGKDSVALISTDNYRIAAHEQLRTFSRILNVPMYVATDAEQLKTVLNVIKDKKLILIDTAGLSKNDISICSQFNAMKNKYPIKTYLVYAANTQRSVIEDIASLCSGIKVEACLITKVDETTNFGGAISVCIESNLPVAYVSDGQKIPENLHVAFSHSLISKNIAIIQEALKNTANLKSSSTIHGTVSHAHG